MATLKKLSDTQIEETDRRGGKVVDVIVWTVGDGGKTLNRVDSDPVHGRKTTSVLEKRP